MKKILFSLSLCSSFLFSNNFNYIHKNESQKENSILNSIKEKNGIKLTEKEEFTLYIKNMLSKTLKYYVDSKLISKLDSSYIEVNNFIKNIHNYEDLFINENLSFLINSSSGDKQSFYISDLIFNISISHENTNYLKLFLEKTKSYNFNFNFDNLELNTAKIKYDLIVSYLLNNNEQLQSFFKMEKNSFLSLYNIKTYSNYFKLNMLLSQINSIGSVSMHHTPSFPDYLYLIKNESELKNNYRDLYIYFKDKLDHDIKNSRIIIETIYLYSSEENIFIKEYDLISKYLISFDIEIPLVNYLLVATNNDEFLLDNSFDLYRNNIEEADIKELYNKYYNIDINSIKLSNLSEKYVTFHKGSFYKTFSKNEFKKRFSKYIAQ